MSFVSIQYHAMSEAARDADLQDGVSAQTLCRRVRNTRYASYRSHGSERVWILSSPATPVPVKANLLSLVQVAQVQTETAAPQID
jgi:hypothetical protein